MSMGGGVLEIRHASIKDCAAIAELEKACFPKAEAASEKSFIDRLSHYPNCFWLMVDDGRIVALVNGMCTDMPDLSDEMFANAALHKEDGAWQMLFGVCTLPEYRKQGLAGKLLCAAIEDTRNRGKKGLVLTCKEALLPYYAKFGFVNEGVSSSVHGGTVWYQMRIKF